MVLVVLRDSRQYADKILYGGTQKMTQDIRAINEKVRQESLFTEELLAELGKVIVGQRYMMERLLVGLFADGHLLLEGVPGLAKTLAVRTLAYSVQAKFQRIQFTPDLLPADLLGTLMYRQASGDFVARKGPIFANVILADEINRAPAKVQSALLEAMEERQVTLGDTSYRLPDPFFVLATENPIEHEGTYPLPEAQLDRFLIKVRATYPSAEEEGLIVRRIGGEAPAAVERVLGAKEIAFLRHAALAVRVDDALADYAVRVVRATRPQTEASRSHGDAMARDIARWLEYGASPRASIHLFRCARASALMDGRSYVLPEDVKAMAPEVLRHRVVLSYEAEAEGVEADAVIARILGALSLP
jgi:MoxR-like ATPase